MCCAKKLVGLLLPIVVLCTAFAVHSNVTLAAVTPGGSFTPPQPWNSATGLTVGMMGNGTLLIDEGDTLTIGACSFGGMPMGMGAGTVTDNATWNLTTTGLTIGLMADGSLYISDGGTVTSAGDSSLSSNTGMAKGTLIVDGNTSLFHTDRNLEVRSQMIPFMMQSVVSLSNGGAVSVGGGTFLDKTALGGGALRFDAGGGTLTTKSLYAGSSALTGTGAGFVVARGWVGDDNLIFDGLDANYGLNQTFAYTSSSRNVSLNLNMSDSTNVGDLGAGYWGNTGSLMIRNGIAVNSTLGIVGYNTGSVGLATVTGADSKWTAGETLTVGNFGNGTLNVLSGGTVSNTKGYIGYESGSSGMVTVDGSDGSEGASTWTNSDSLHVGGAGNGTLEITNGGCVSSASSIMADTSGQTATVTVDGLNSKWVNGTLSVGDGGTAMLNITDGGHVTTTGTTYVAVPNATGTPNGVGTINFSDGTLTTSGLWVMPSQLTGTGVINTKGFFGDVDLTFDGTASCSFTFGTAIATTVDLSATSGNGDLGIGYSGISNVSMTVKSGVSIYSANGCIGYGSDTRGTATVDGADWNLSEDLVVGSYGRGTLIIQNGGSVSNLGDGIIGNIKDSGGLVQVEGGSTWNIGGTLEIGNLGGALVVITNGTVSNAGMGCIACQDTSRGTVTVDGPSAAWISTDGIIVGKDSRGILSIANGGVVFTDGTTVVGDMSTGGMGSSGSMIEFGTGGGTLTTKSLHTAAEDLTGAGTIITNGLVSNVNLTFDSTASLNQTLTGAGSFGSVIVNLDLSDSSNVGNLGVGHKGGASLVIRNGITVHSTIGYLGETDSTYTATVEDNGTWIIGDLLFTGGTGTLDIQSGGMISATAIYGSSNGTVSFDGGTLQAQATNPSFLQNFGKAYVKAGGVTIDSNGCDIAIYQLLETDGVGTGGLTKIGDGTLTLRNANTYTGTTVVEAGTLALDAAAQTVVLTGGGADIQGGKLVFNHSGGTVTGGQVWDLLDDSFDTSFTSGQIFSSTAQTNGMAIGWDDNGSEVTVMYTLYGDSNLDGSVNGSDLNAVLSYYNQSTDLVWGSQIWAHGDFNYDGSVNGSDLNTVLSNYNKSLSASTAAVPEPSTWLLMVLGLAGLLAYRRVRACTHQ